MTRANEQMNFTPQTSRYNSQKQHPGIKHMSHLYRVGCGFTRTRTLSCSSQPPSTTSFLPRCLNTAAEASTDPHSVLPLRSAQPKHYPKAVAVLDSKLSELAYAPSERSTRLKLYLRGCLIWIELTALVEYPENIHRDPESISVLLEYMYQRRSQADGVGCTLAAR